MNKYFLSIFTLFIVVFSGCSGGHKKAKPPCDLCTTSEQAKASGCTFPEGNSVEILDTFWPACSEPQVKKASAGGKVYDFSKARIQHKKKKGFGAALGSVVGVVGSTMLGLPPEIIATNTIGGGVGGGLIGNSVDSKSTQVPEDGTENYRNMADILSSPDFTIIEVTDPSCEGWMTDEQKKKYTCQAVMDKDLFMRYDEECWAIDDESSEYPAGFYSKNRQTRRIRELLKAGNQPDPEKGKCDKGLDKRSKYWEFQNDQYKISSGLSEDPEKVGPLLSHPIPLQNNDDSDCKQIIFSAEDWIFRNIYSKNTPEIVRKKTSAPHHALCRPGLIKAQCVKTDYFKNNDGKSTQEMAKNTVGDSAGPENMCPPGTGSTADNNNDSEDLGNGAQTLVGPILTDLLSGSSGAGVDTTKDPLKLGSAISSDAKAVYTPKNSSALDSKNRGGGASDGGSSDGILSGTPSLNKPSGGGSANSPGASSLLGTSNTQNGAGAAADGNNEEQSAKSKDVEYESSKVGSSGKSGGGVDFANMFGGANGGAGGTNGAGVTASGFGAFGKKNNDSSVQLTDAEIEALLGKNAGSSLFEIASRRYFKWGRDVLGHEAREQMQH